MKSRLLFLLMTMTALFGATDNLQPINVDAEVARVRKKMQEVQGLSISRDAKIQKQRELLDRELASAKAAMAEIQKQNVTADGTKKKSMDTENNKEQAEAARERRRRAMDNVQKFMDIIRSMHPMI